MPQDYAVLEALSAEGKSAETIAARIGVGTTTLSAILRRDERAAEARRRGLAAEHDMAIQSMREQCANGYFPACRWLLEHRHGYSQPEESARVNVKVLIPEQLTVEEYTRQLKDVTPERRELPESTTAEVIRA